MSKIPIEILELILLEAVDEVTPLLAIDFKTGIRSLRWKKDLRSGRSVLVDMLALRLVSRAFHKAAWKAFGKVLGETIFDMHSPDSMITLQTMSRCKALAPWVTKLTVGFYSAPRCVTCICNKTYCSHTIKEAKGQQLLHQIRTKERSLWPGSETWDEGGLDTSEESGFPYGFDLDSQIDASAASAQLLSLVTRSLKGLPNSRQ